MTLCYKGLMRYTRAPTNSLHSPLLLLLLWLRYVQLKKPPQAPGVPPSHQRAAWGAGSAAGAGRSSRAADGRRQGQPGCGCHGLAGSCVERRGPQRARRRGVQRAWPGPRAYGERGLQAQGKSHSQLIERVTKLGCGLGAVQSCRVHLLGTHTWKED